MELLLESNYQLIKKLVKIDKMTRDYSSYAQQMDDSERYTRFELVQTNMREMMI